LCVLPCRFSRPAITLATPLYSNTTLVSFFPTLGWGGSVYLMPVRRAALPLRRCACHPTMLVPVQYQRIMALPRFGDFDLSTFLARVLYQRAVPHEPQADLLAR
jgi:hypothetical protein